MFHLVQLYQQKLIMQLQILNQMDYRVRLIKSEQIYLFLIRNYPYLSITHKSMNKSIMKSPVISELYSQKLIHSAHLKKLQDIKQNHKNRTRLIQSIRQNKLQTFAISHNQQYNQINKQNMSIIRKLTHVKPSSVCQKRCNTSYDDGGRLNLSSRSKVSFRDSGREKSLEKENQRLFVKLRAVSSNLKSQKFVTQHQKAERIKQRIMRYASDPNDSTKFGLKTEKLITLRGSYMEGNSTATASRRESKSVDMKRKGTASYYNKEQIISNTIQKIQQKYGTQNNVLKQATQAQTENEEETFLTAQNNHQVAQSKQIKRVSTLKSKNSISYMKESMRGKRVFVDESSSRGTALYQPIQKLEKIKLNKILDKQKKGAE